MKRLLKALPIALVMGLSGAVLLPVQAQNLLPKQITDIFNLFGPNGVGAAGFIRSRVQLGLVIVLGIVVLAAVVYAIMAALKYIQSQGESGKIEEAQKAIKAIFFGIGAMLLAIVGIILIFVFFGASQPQASIYQTCISYPDSDGCKDCIGGAKFDGSTVTDAPNADCNKCETEVAANNITDAFCKTHY